MSAKSQPVLNTASGPIEGFQVGDVNRFTGIPYATAARFEAPRPIEPWTTTFKATQPVPACPQPQDPTAGSLLKRPLLQGLSIDEYCQKITVTTPLHIKPDEKLSVMVWCHGGAFVFGAADAEIYNPSSLVSENRVIVVNVGSRLGVFGYLGDGSASRPANLGLLDVLEALRWIKKNIAAFGGNDDPRSITLFGQSAGGSTVSDLMACEEASSLFGRVIVQSAPFGITRGRDAMNKATFEEVKDASAALSVDEMVKLSNKVNVRARAFGNMGGMPFAPQYGFAPLPSEKELEATLDAVAPRIDVLVGHTAEEATMFVGFIPAVDKASRLPLIGSFFRRAFVSWATSMLYTKGAQSFVQRYVKAGGKASYYLMTWASKNPKVGSMHAIEIPLLFGDEEVWAGAAFLEGHSWQKVQEDGKKLRKIWADFAKGQQVDSEDSVEGIIEITKQ